MGDKTVLDFTLTTDAEDTDVLYVIRGTGAGRDRYVTKATLLKIINSEEINVDNLTVDVIAEKTVDAGVTIEGILLKDSIVSADKVNTGQGDNELYEMDQNVKSTDNPTFAGSINTASVEWKHYYEASNITEDNIFEAIQAWAFFGTILGCHGHLKSGASEGFITGINRNGSSTIIISYISAIGTASTITITDGGAVAFAEIAIMSNFDSF